MSVGSAAVPSAPRPLSASRRRGSPCRWSPCFWSVCVFAACARGSNIPERPGTSARGGTPVTLAETARASSASDGSAVASSAGPATASPPVYFEQLIARARALAAEPAQPPPRLALPDELEELRYDDYRKIRFRPEHSLWRGEPGEFEVQFFHAGPGYREPVFVSVLEGGQEQPVRFTRDWFSYDGLAAPPPTDGLEFAGLRVHVALNRDDYRDEVLAFHGASYFRAVGKGSVYGLSARGLAIDLGEPKPEEFPRFSRFVLVRPGPEDHSLWLLALLESRRATGAYAFHLQPGAPTLIDVTAEIFLRETGAVLGLSPLTSMYLSGEDEPNRFGDFRPEVHDSDGLSLHASSGEWLYRPLRNPERTVTSSFRLDAPRGFGLLQRDRDFDHYQDLEARYQDRPSVWIEPISGFDRGSVRLLEIPARVEFNDNIALCWVPDVTPQPARALALRYRLHVGNQGIFDRAQGQVEATRLARTERGARFLVDFALPQQDRTRPVELVLSVGGAHVLEQHVEDNPLGRGLRASFEVAAEPNAKGSKDVELRAFLRRGGDVLTETWSYLWQPR
jgi:periplasmic glucans biosynthesis protein